ncbi:MAG: hypothetical protein ACYTG0_30060 [Planctomycetota bacterium]
MAEICRIVVVLQDHFGHVDTHLVARPSKGPYYGQMAAEMVEKTVTLPQPTSEAGPRTNTSYRSVAAGPLPLVAET